MLAAVASLGLLATSCDPVKEDGSFEVLKPTADNLLKGATFTQCRQVTDEAGNVTGYEEAADGNYIFYNIPSVNSVVIFNYNADGSEFDLSKNTGNQAYASGGMFALVPARGSDSHQTVYFRYTNAVGEEVVASKEFNVYVPADISAELKLLTSNASSDKTWTWDTSVNGGGWGNAGYTGDTGENFVATGSGTWWACPPEDLTGQMDHSVDKLTGDCSPLATMVFNENGTVKCFDADGNEFRSGTFSIENWNGGERTEVNGQPWLMGTLKTSEGATLWPFEMNAKDRGGAKYVTAYEILELSYDKLVLVYPDEGSQGGWGEAAWWRFKSNTDDIGMLTNNDKAKWTWDTSVNGGGWGNAGYKGDTGENFAETGSGTWWACPPADLLGQLGHAVGSEYNADGECTKTAPATGAEDEGAYMIFDAAGLVTSYDKDGNKIGGSTYEILNYTGARDADNWSLGTLHTGENSILWPFEINAKGKYVTDYEIVKLTGSQMVLVYPDGGSQGAWGEASWWRFKKVE